MKSDEINQNLSKMKSLVKETLYNSMSQTIIKIIDTPYFTLKAFLCLCLILSSGVCSYLITKLILDYLSYGVVTTSRILYEMPAIFPKITICNFNQFTTEYALGFLKQINSDFIPSIDIFDETQMNQLDFPTKSYMINYINTLASNKMNSLNETEKRKLSRPLEDILASCSFNQQTCSFNDFSWYFDPWLGNCWQFNTGLNVSTNEKINLRSNSAQGFIYGLQLIFYVNFNENLTLFN